MRSRELEKALEEIEKSDDIYRTVGPVLIKVEKNKIKDELDDEKEETDIKLKTLETQEDRIKEKIKGIQEKFESQSHMMGQGG